MLVLQSSAMNVRPRKDAVKERLPTMTHSTSARLANQESAAG